MTSHRFFSSVLALIGACTLVIAGAARADSLSVAPPLPPTGPYPIACSNMAQDFSRLRSGEDAQDYWEGFPRDDGSGRYVTDLISDPANSLFVNVDVPNDSGLYGDFAGKRLPTSILVCYPTSPANGRPDYALPTGRYVPHMQMGAEAPIWPDDTTRFPVLLFTTGLGGSPISNDYISALAVFATYGYVVAAPFHGDARITDIRLDGLSDIFYAILHFREFVAMQALRPLALKVTLDVILAHPHYRDRVDPNRIGGFGASQGGESLMLMTGARLTTTVGQSSQTVLTDTRLKAIVGYVPYFGQPVYPAFGRRQDGLQGITVPYLAISGTEDTTAPLETTADGINRLAGTRGLVALNGTHHEFDYTAETDIFTWSLAFLAAHAQDDRLARAQVSRMQAVGGPGNDISIIDYTAPALPSADERIVVEYHNANLNHYFITAEPAEAAMLDAGILVPGWVRTGFNFKAWAPESPRGLSACRFYGTPGVGPNSHFYTLNADECALRKTDPFWTYESIAFQAFPTSGEDCPADLMLVNRMYNNGMGGQANHRYLTSHSEVEVMKTRGWILEGPVFCTPP
jgi:predicted dienelactone hydrolase